MESSPGKAGTGPADDWEGLGLDGLTRLDAPCPGLLAEALGYVGHGRYLAVWRLAHDGRRGTGPGADLCLRDRIRSAAVGWAENWHRYSSHPAVAPRLAGFDLGSDDHDGADAIVVDRGERAVWAGRRARAEAALGGPLPLEVPPPQVAVDKTWLERRAHARSLGDRLEEELPPY